MLVTCLLVPAIAKEATATEKPGVVAAYMAVMTATVQAVDYKKRTITLKDPDGRVDTIEDEASLILYSGESL